MNILEELGMKENGLNKEETNLEKKLKTLLGWKWFILGGTIGVTLIIAVIVFLMPGIYKSSAVVSLSTVGSMTTADNTPKGLDLPIYKYYSSIFRNRKLLQEYLGLEGEDVAEWRLALNFFDNHIKPVNAFEKRARVKETEDSVLALQLTETDPVAEKATKRIRILGDYLITTILNEKINEFIDSTKIDSNSVVVTLNSAIIKLKQDINDLYEKEKLLKEQVLKIPVKGKGNERELVNVSKETEKYLSPYQQLVAVMVAIKDLQLQIADHKRTIAKNRAILDYLKAVEKYFKEEKNYLVSKQLLTNLIQEKEKFFSNKTDEESQLADNKLTWSFLNFERLKKISYKFIAEPTVPEKPFKPKRKRIVAGAFFLSFFVFVFLALGLDAWKR
jgi:LPS O-antigen subunit length determinant protein (WzzB/FepE family)